MDDLGNYKIIFYIILAILYFLFKGKKKSKEAEPPQNKPVFEQQEVKPYTPPQNPVRQPKPILSRPVRPVALPKAQEPVKTAPVSLEDLLKEFGKGLEEPSEEYRKEEVNVKETSQEVTNPKVVDYDEGIAEAEVVTEAKNSTNIEEIVFGKDDHFEAYAINEVKVNKYAEMLKDPEGAKTAFIAGEIFNRKF